MLYHFILVAIFMLQVVKHVKNIKQCDSGLGEELAQMRELYRREALQRKLLYNQVQLASHNIIVDSLDKYSAASNNMKLVHWPLMGWVLHLVQRGGDSAGPQTTQAHPLLTVPNITTAVAL